MYELHVGSISEKSTMQMYYNKMHTKCSITESMPLRSTYTVFSPGRGLAGFPQEKLKWRIKTKKMHPLGRRGKLRVKRT